VEDGVKSQGKSIGSTIHDMECCLKKAGSGYVYVYVYSQAGDGGCMCLSPRC